MTRRDIALPPRSVSSTCTGLQPNFEWECCRSLNLSAPILKCPSIEIQCGRIWTVLGWKKNYAPKLKYAQFETTGWPVKHGCVFSGTLEKVTFPVYSCTLAYTEQVTFYKVPEIHGHVYLVPLYIMTMFNGILLHQNYQYWQRQRNNNKIIVMDS